MKEKDFSSKVMKELQELPEVLYAQRVETGDTCPGTPDIYLMCIDRRYADDPVKYRGRISHIWLELKTTSKLRQSQVVWHRKYKKAGGLVGVLKPGDDVPQMLMKIIKEGR